MSVPILPQNNSAGHSLISEPDLTAKFEHNWKMTDNALSLALAIRREQETVS